MSIKPEYQTKLLQLNNSKFKKAFISNENENYSSIYADLTQIVYLNKSDRNQEIFNEDSKVQTSKKIIKKENFFNYDEIANSDNPYN